jgi:two-component system sensor histidine kinase LytS
MFTELIKSILLNICLLVVIAQMLAKTKVVKKFIVSDKYSLRDQLVMIAIFSIISILSTYTGYEVNGAIANTRVIGVMAAGFIGGPVVGIGTAVLAGLHRYLIDIHGIASVACTLSTIAEGLIAAAFAGVIKKNKYKGLELFFITFFAEIIQMLIILLVARPYSSAVELVRIIAGPMVLVNSIGMILFIGVFKHILLEIEYKIGRKVGQAIDITQKCLPLLRTGVYNEENCNQIGKIVLEFSKDLDVLFTDTEKILSVSRKTIISDKTNSILPEIVKKVLKEQCVCIAEETEKGDPLYSSMSKMAAIGAPFIKRGEAFGCMVIFIQKYKVSFELEKVFADKLSKLFSVQYELSDIDKQNELLQKAEFQALQSQINPHFIFNSLNTISSFCREKPEKARELLVALATYFRKSIQSQDGFVSIYEEMDYVDAYLQLVKARFDDRLHLTVKMPKKLNCNMPCLIVQPIVENAIIHGAMKRKSGEVSIMIKEELKRIKITVTDNGYGIPPDIVSGIQDNTLSSNSIGLSNVQRRLCYAYGKGLDIITSPKGTTIHIMIPKMKLR